MNTIQLRVERSIAHQSILGVIRSGDGKSFMTDITFKKAEEGVWIPDTSMFRLDDSQAQLLMDDLWSCGVRPTEGAGSAGAMRRAELHITDLQKVAFTLLDAVTKEVTKGIK